MTIRAMPRVLLVALLVAAPACQQAQASRSGPTPRELELAADLDALRTQVRQIRVDDKHLGRLARTATGHIQALGHRLDRVATRLADLKEKLADGGAIAASAAADAKAAAARAAELAQQLAILEQRFDYHLKHSQGGG